MMNELVNGEWYDEWYGKLNPICLYVSVVYPIWTTRIAN